MENICDTHGSYSIKTEKSTFQSLYDNLNQTFLTTLVYSVGIGVGAWVISKYIWDREVVMENQEPEEEEELYESKYPIDKLRDISGNKPQNTTIIEHTPDGSIIMSYNYDKEAFEYWSDKKNIKYDYLETVARKFVKMNFCVDLYVDRKENIKKQNEELDRLEKEEKEKDKEKKKKADKEFKKMEEEDSVFVKSKISKKEKQKREIIDRKKIAATDANKYIRVGKWSEYNWIIKEKKERKGKKISFSDFKSLKNNFC